MAKAKKYKFTAARKRALKKAQAAAKRARRGGIKRSSSKSKASSRKGHVHVHVHISEKALHRAGVTLGRKGGRVTASRRRKRRK